MQTSGENFCLAQRHFLSWKLKVGGTPIKEFPLSVHGGIRTHKYQLPNELPRLLPVGRTSEKLKHN